MMTKLSCKFGETSKSLPCTGTQINYYWICRRKLWLYSHQIEMEFASGNQNVQLGKLIDEMSYSRSKKHIGLEGIQIDWMSSPKIVHEVKKTDKMEKAHIWQLKYYLYHLKNLGIKDVVGELDYPRLKKRKEIAFTLEDEKRFQIIFSEIETILAGSVPGKIERTSICRKCSYYEYCYV